MNRNKSRRKHGRTSKFRELILASCGNNGTVNIHKFTRSRSGMPFEHELVKSFSPFGSGRCLSTVMCNSNGAVLAIAGDDGQVALTDMAGRSFGFLPPEASDLPPISTKWIPGHQSDVSALSLSRPSLGLLASGDENGEIFVGGVSSHDRSFRLLSPSDNLGALNSLSFSPKECHMLAAAYGDGSVLVWDCKQHNISSSFRNAHRGQATSTVFAPTNALLCCSAGLDGRILLFDRSKKKGLIKEINCGEPLTCLDFEREGVRLAVGTRAGNILVYDLRKTDAPCTVPALGDAVNQVRFCTRHESGSKITHSRSKHSGDSKRAPEVATARETRKNMYGNTHVVEHTYPDSANVTREPSVDSLVRNKFGGPSLVGVSRIDTNDTLSAMRTPPPAHASLLYSPEGQSSAFPTRDSGVLVSKYRPDLVPRNGQGRKDVEIAMRSHQHRLQSPEASLPAMKSEHTDWNSHREVSDMSTSHSPRRGAEMMHGDASSQQYALLKSVIDDSLQSFRKSIHEDISNLHLELLRQFHLQQIEFSAILDRLLAQHGMTIGSTDCGDSGRDDSYSEMDVDE